MLVVAISDGLFSFVAGFAVFATLGHLAFLEDLEEISDLEISGFGLVFGSWPVTLVCGSHAQTINALPQTNTFPSSSRALFQVESTGSVFSL